MYMTDEWVFFEPDITKKYTIIVFDDGNERYKYYTNEWFVIGRWRGKVAIQNSVIPDMKVSSISEWKIIPVSTISEL
jgi:hypothetical protein